MNKEEKLKKLETYLSKIDNYTHTIKILNYDLETACPEKGMDDDSDGIVTLQEMIFHITKSEEYISLVKDIHDSDFESLDPYEKTLIHTLYKSIRQEENIDEKTINEANELFSKAYMQWLKAKKEGDYKQFSPVLKSIYETQSKLLKLRYDYLEDDPYTTLFDDYEEGFTSQDLDNFFDDLEREIVPLYKKIRESKYTPRHDFLTRKVVVSKQEAFTDFLIKHNGFDFTRGSVSTTEHPFTEQFSFNDVRVTTKYMENNFISNMYSIIHEGGHALFGQNIPQEVFSKGLGEGVLSMGKHESVSRFYENIIGRSKAYIDSIYPEFLTLFKEELGDITADDFYQGVNYVDINNPLRTEADELTYSLHIIIRYRLERMIMSGKADFDTLNSEWNRLYKELLGIEVKNDKEGILQDVHWTGGFGYFPTYALGNALNCIYVKKLDKEINLEKTVREGRMDLILDWMKKNVFEKAPVMNTKEWIKEISGEEFSAKPYIEYLKAKFSALYHLD
ncbi:MAG: carboxypeptidase M32 [Bacilli bacterium]